METSFYCFSLILLLFVGFCTTKGSQASLNCLPVIGLINGLIRPEANLLVAIVFILVFFSVEKKNQFVLKIVLLYLLPALGYFIWRWTYYGLLFPLPFYIKSGTFSLAGKDYVLNFLIFLFNNLLLYLGLAIIKRNDATKLIGVVAISDLIFFLFVSPIMGYDYRFLFPLVPLFLVFSAIGISTLLQNITVFSDQKKWSIFTSGWMVSLLIIIFLSNNLPRTSSLFSHKLDYANGMLSNHIYIGQTLSKVDHNQTTPVLVVTDAGAMSYYSGWYTIDAGGLNDDFIATSQGDILRYIFENDPDVIVLTSNNLFSFTTDSSYVKSIYEEAISQGMILVSQKPFYQGDSIWILSKPESEIVNLFNY